MYWNNFLLPTNSTAVEIFVTVNICCSLQFCYAYNVLGKYIQRFGYLVLSVQHLENHLYDIIIFVLHMETIKKLLHSNIYTNNVCFSYWIMLVW